MNLHSSRLKGRYIFRDGDLISVCNEKVIRVAARRRRLGSFLVIISIVIKVSDMKHVIIATIKVHIHGYVCAVTIGRHYKHLRG